MKPGKTRRVFSSSATNPRLSQARSAQQLSDANEIFSLLGFPANLTTATTLTPQGRRYFQQTMATIAELIIVFLSEIYKADQISFTSQRNNESLAQRNPIVRNLMMILRDDPAKTKLLTGVFQKYWLNIFLINFLAGQTMPLDFKPIYQQLFRALKNPQESLRILDIGAGLNGLFYLFNQTISSRHQIVLIDKSEFIVNLWQMGKSAQKSEVCLTPNQNVTFRQQDFLTLPDEAEAYDLLVAILLFRYINKKDQARFFQQARKLLRQPTGTLTIVDTIGDLNNKGLANDIEQVAAENGLAIKDSGFFTESHSGQEAFAYELVAA